MPRIEFTIVYDWLANRTNLNWPEKIILAHILRYGRSEYGCFKSNGNIAKSLGLSRVTVIRIISRLEDSGWIVKKTYPARERSLFVNQEKLDDMPLLAGVKGCGKPVKSLTGASGAALLSSGAAPPVGSGAAPPGLNRNRKQCFLRDNEETKEKRENFSRNLMMKHKKRMQLEDCCGLHSGTDQLQSIKTRTSAGEQENE